MNKQKKDMHTDPPLLEVKDFSLTFRQYKQGLREDVIEVVRHFNLTIRKGEIVAIVGASGSGKSLLANAILGILPKNAQTHGTLNYKGEPLTKKKQVALRGKAISLIPQSVNALDPLMQTGKQVQAVIKKKNKREKQQAIFKKVGLHDGVSHLYPFELSGGMSRRVLASTAMVSDAELVIADEPTPGLDPSSLHETLKNVKQLATDGKGIMFITHDIEVALQLADKIAVFNAGETLEIAKADDFSGKGEKLRHPYSKALWNALPQNDFISGENLHIKWDKTTKNRSFESEHTETTNQNNTLNVTDIGYHYHNKPWLFKNLNLAIKPGEIVGLFGYSGSGKSTMAQVIGGYKKSIEGAIHIGSNPVLNAGSYPIQLVWQHPEKAINPRWRMKKIVQESENFSAALMTSLGIKHEWLNRWPSELSGGELQRFSLARALAAENIQFLIADEMTTMLDAITQAQIWHAMVRLAKERDIGVLAISHNQSLLYRVCDKIINFDDII